MSNRSVQASTAEKIILLPLSRLKKSPSNVRQVPHTKAGIAELAASIRAVGLLQNLVVEAEKKGDKPTGFYLVTAGEGRRLAQLLRVKKKEITTEEPMRCVIASGSATEISLAENAIRTDMHPADQFCEAFQKLHRDEGRSAEEIAAAFGVTPAVVRQRLKLGAVSPKLLKRYRADEMTLDQLTAFAITDDHAKQEKVWKALGDSHCGRGAILRALTEGQVETHDRRALFIGAEAYREAGGVITQDLFGGEAGGFFADPDLLNRLVDERMQEAGKAVAAEGWKWISVAPGFSYEDAAKMRRVYPDAVKLSVKERQRLRKLQTRLDNLIDRHGEDMPPESMAKAERLQDAIDRLQRYVYKPADLARAGAFVSLSHGGAINIERGYVRPEDDAAKKAPKKGKGAPSGKPSDPPLAEKLIADLTAHRTAGLRNALAKSPSTALVAAVHALAVDAFYPGGENVTSVELRLRSVSLTPHTPEIERGTAGAEIAERHAAWKKRLPRAPSKLWEFVQGLPEDERMALFAHCVGLSVNAVERPNGASEAALAHAAILAKTTALDMRRLWQPTVASYLGRVSKDRILEAVREAVSDAAASKIATMKKPAMADAAEKLLAGKGWLPPILRA